MSLLWRVFLTNAVVFAGATAVLALSPATVSFPLALTEAVVLVVGLGAMLAIDFALLRRAFAPLSDLTGFMRSVDPLSPGGRAGVARPDPEVAELTEAFNEMIERVETERRESARRAVAAQEAERLRIARELHDGVGQSLTAVMLELESGVRGDMQPEDLASTREALRLTLEEVREIARGLRPEALDDLGLPAALAALTNELSRRARLRIVRRIDRELPPLGADEELVVYRVAQEALTNVVRHSDAAQAELELRGRPGSVELVVRDHGRGLPATVDGDGAGLRGMRERALLVGARLEVESRPGAGTEVRLRIDAVGGER